MTRKPFLQGLLFVFAALMCSVSPALAQGVGAIGGTVMDSSGAVLPGATITLTSAQGTVGSNQEVVSDSRGAYQFQRLVPGTYSVKATMSGFRQVEQRNIVVNADATARADLSLPLGQLEEGVVVSGEAPLLDTTSALRQTVLSADTLEMLPNRMDVWAITRVIPSVVVSKVDVGGSESFQQSGITVHGTNTEGGYYVDGMDVSHMDGAGAGATFYIDPYAYAENNFLSGNSPAESPRGGLVFNMITRTGTNQIHGGADFSGMGSSMGFNNVDGALRLQLLRNIPAKILVLNPDLAAGADIQYLYDTGMWLAGPIKQDKLWFSTSLHYQKILQYLLGSYNTDGTQVPDDNDLFNSSSKIAWQVNSTSQLSYFYTIQHKVNGHRASTTMFVESGATQRNEKMPQVHQIKWTSTPNSKMVFDASTSVFRVSDEFTPPKEGKMDMIAGFDQVTNTLLRILPTYTISDMRRTVVQVGASYFTPSHDIKTGVQLNHGSLSPYGYSSSNMRAVYRNGVPDSVNTYNTPTYSDQKDREMAYYVQDRWRPSRKITMNLGLRAETNYGWMNAACQTGTAFVAAKCYDPLKGFPDWTAVNPRFSMIYDLAGDGRTALKFAANRYITPVGKSIVERVNPIAIVSDTRRWTACAAGQASECDLNGDLLPQINELGPSSGYPFGVNNRYASDTKWPWSRELTGEVQRQFMGNLVLTVGYTHREKLGLIGSRNMAVPTSTYIPLQVTEANSGKQVTVYNQAPALRGLNDFLWNNEDALNSSYNGTDITLDKRMSNGWMMTGGVSLGKNIGDIYGTSDLNNPNFQYRRGLQGNDVPFSLRLSGVYDLPWKISMSGTYQRQSGFPEITAVSVGNNTVTLTQGTTSVTVDPRGTTRLPDLNQLDMSFRRMFRVGNKTMQPRIDFYNLMNSATITSRNNTLGSSYFAVNSIQRGALIKVGMNVDW
ncbi:MAG: carboxypeptidase regulatory-like domain-containing protein [Vicinamibacterales bacterium]|nr:carboxypeptidase regulatory-like domain-containing protein [Vicinamibacterales bacterium]